MRSYTCCAKMLLPSARFLHGGALFEEKLLTGTDYLSRAAARLDARALGVPVAIGTERAWRTLPRRLPPLFRSCLRQLVVCASSLDALSGWGLLWRAWPAVAGVAHKRRGMTATSVSPLPCRRVRHALARYGPLVHRSCASPLSLTGS